MSASDASPALQFWYSFGLQPTARQMGTWGSLAADVLTRLAHNNRRYDNLWTEEQFNIARDQLAQAGYEIRECSRTPYAPQEVVL